MASSSGGGIGALAGVMGFANGGIMSGLGSLPLNKYAGGGVANSPQLALFGEGKMNEAYVPLPDGRSIPVTMKGGAGGATSVVIQINVKSDGTTTSSANSDAQGWSKLADKVRGVVVDEMLTQQRPGGILYK
jgi:hypothetical protein